MDGNGNRAKPKNVRNAKSQFSVLLLKSVKSFEFITKDKW